MIEATHRRPDVLLGLLTLANFTDGICSWSVHNGKQPGIGLLIAPSCAWQWAYIGAILFVLAGLLLTQVHIRTHDRSSVNVHSMAD